MQSGKKCRHVHIPAGLSRGDSVGIVAPASPFDRAAFDKGVAVVEALGYRPVFAEGLFSRNGYLAGSDRRRARQLERFFDDPLIKAVLCARGGFGSLRVLPLLDFERIGRHPKILVGFSDLTALLAALVKMAGMLAFHGPTVTCLADASPETRQALAEALRLEGPAEIRPPGDGVVRPGTGSGPLIGGNLSVLCHLLGTPFSPEFAGALLLLEDRGEKTYRIDRMLTHLKLAGCFRQVAGVVLGDFAECGDRGAIFQMVADAVGARDIPILGGLPVGHGETNLTVPLGCRAVLETDPARLRFPSVRPGA